MGDLIQDVKYGLRVLRRRPGFTAAAVLTLTVGIGANTAVFSVANAVLLHRLPFAEADRLVRLYDVRRRDGGEVSQVSFSPRNFHAVREQARSFEAVAAQVFLNLNMAQSGGAERVVGIGVSDGWLDTLGVRPAAGRGFSAEEEAAGGAASVALVSYGFWERRFGSDPNLVGRTITLNGRGHTVVGVMPRAFDYPYHSEVWLPWDFDRENGRVHNLNVQARLRADVSREQAQAELDAVAARLAREYPATNAGYQMRAVPLRDVLVEGRGRVVLLLLGAVGFLLLVACANVANLLLAQAIGRRREFAVRAALGATRARQARQLVTENLLISAAGGAAGLLLTLWLRDALMALVPPDLTYLMKEVPISKAVVLFALLASVLVGVALAFFPLMRSSRLDLNALLKEGGRAGDSGGERLLNVLVVGEIAVALVLLAGAGLMIRNLYLLQRADLGVDTENLLTMKVTVPEEIAGDARRRGELIKRVVEQVETAPGVTLAAAANLLPLTGGNVTASVAPEGRAYDPNEQLVVSYRAVTPGFFETLRLPLLAGRAFSEQDNAQAQQVAIVSRQMARRYWPGEDPVGRRLRVVRGGAEAPWLTVVGVAGDTRETSSSREVRETLYVPAAQDATGERTFTTTSFHLGVRTAGDPAAAAAGVREAIWRADKNLSVFDVETARELYRRALAPTRVGSVMLLSFAGFGLLLAVVGTYGVFSYRVARRRREMGIRMALGAERGDIMRLVMRQGALLAVVGVVIGLGGALALTRLMEGLLSEVRPGDPVTLAAAALLLAAVALLACYLPARRATKADPLLALREE